jgi:universal stress protein A
MNTSEHPASVVEPALRVPSLRVTHEEHLEKLEAIPAIFAVKHILVPTDFSDLSMQALKYALPIAEKFDAKITLIHILEYTPIMPVYGVAEPPEVMSDMIEERERRLEAIAREVGHKYLENTVVRSGSASDSIVHYATEWSYDLIILTTHGSTGLRHLFMGSTAEKVVRHAQCPVLVVHSRKVSEEEEAPKADLYGHVL